MRSERQDGTRVTEEFTVARPRNPIVSEMGWSTSDTIVVRGKDLPAEVLGHVNLGDMAFLEVMNRLPPQRSRPSSTPSPSPWWSTA
jgi:hypothetical protein